MDMEGVQHALDREAVSGNKTEKLKQACADFEAIFIHYLLKSAREAGPQNGLLDNTQESKVYRSLADQQLAQSMARGRGLGLGQLLYEQLKNDTEKGEKAP